MGNLLAAKPTRVLWLFLGQMSALVAASSDGPSSPAPAPAQQRSAALRTLIPNRIPAEAGGRTLFGLSYSDEEAAVVVADSPRRSSRQKSVDKSLPRKSSAPGPAGKKGPVENPPAPRVTRPANIDYRQALHATPVEMIFRDKLIIDGKVVGLGEAFGIDLGLDYLTKQSPAVGETVPVVHCVFRVKAIQGGIVTLEVLPDLPQFPARDQMIRYRFSN